MDGDPRITLTEALEDVSLGEIRMAERFFGKTFGEEGVQAMTPMEALAMGIFARERRLRPNGGFTLKDTDQMSMRAANAYFDEEIKEVDEDNPESDEGKDSNAGEKMPENEPSSAPY